MADKRFNKHLDELLKTKPFSREILSLSVGFKEIAQPLKFSTRNDGDRGSQQQNVMVSFGTIFFSFRITSFFRIFSKLRDKSLWTGLPPSPVSYINSTNIINKFNQIGTKNEGTIF